MHLNVSSFAQKQGILLQRHAAH